MFFGEFSFGCFINPSYLKNTNVSVMWVFVGFVCLFVFNLRFSANFIVIATEKELKPRMGLFFSYPESRLSISVLHSVILMDSVSVLSWKFSILSVCLYELLGAIVVAERAFVRIKVCNRYIMGRIKCVGINYNFVENSLESV